MITKNEQAIVDLVFGVLNQKLAVADKLLTMQGVPNSVRERAQHDKDILTEVGYDISEKIDTEYGVEE